MENRKDYHKQWYLKNRVSVLKKQKIYYENNKEKIAEREKIYYETHKEKRLEYNKKAKDKRIKWHRKYREKNKKKIDERIKKWHQTPRGKANRKAKFYKRKLSKSDITTQVIEKVYKDNILKYGILTCILCNKLIGIDQDSLEHKTPLSRGGDNNYENLGVAHRICNSRKNKKTLEEWFYYTKKVGY